MTTPQITSLLIAVLGVALAGYGVWAFRRASASSAWPMVTGKITACRLHEDHSEDADDKWNVEVEYEYDVGGHTFTSNQVAFGKDTFTVSGHAALRVADQYPLHSPIPVYHHPADPSRAVLEPGETKYAMGVLGISGIMALLGLGYAFL